VAEGGGSGDEKQAGFSLTIDQKDNDRSWILNELMSML